LDLLDNGLGPASILRKASNSSEEGLIDTAILTPLEYYSTFVTRVATTTTYPKQPSKKLQAEVGNLLKLLVKALNDFEYFQRVDFWISAWDPEAMTSLQTAYPFLGLKCKDFTLHTMIKKKTFFIDMTKGSAVENLNSSCK
jgi:hypothetical protein